MTASIKKKAIACLKFQQQFTIALLKNVRIIFRLGAKNNRCVAELIKMQVLAVNESERASGGRRDAEGHDWATSSTGSAHLGPCRLRLCRSKYSDKVRKAKMMEHLKLKFSS